MPAPYDSSPAIQALAVTPGTPFPACRALYIGTGGNFTPTLENGGTPAFKNAQSGSIIPIRCINVSATDLTADDIVALY